MTDNEIIKGMNRCKSNTIGKCIKCPLDRTEYCCDEVPEPIIDLINRQKAENSNLTSDLTSLQKDLTSAKAEIESLEAENKLLIDRNCELAEKGEKAIITFVKSQKETKAEAVKEFAERLKIRFAGTISCNAGAIYNAADKILKGVVGEENSPENKKQN